MNKTKLNAILRKHSLWLNNEKGGIRADLRNTDLQGANLQGANLWSADLRGAYLESADLRGTILRSADLRGAYLESANLQGANLRNADLRGANLDFASFPLWCGGKGWVVDEHLPRMLLAFICSMQCDNEEIKAVQALIRSEALKSHRAEEILG